VEVVPQGIFDVDVQSMGYTASGDLKITAPDRWARVQRASSWPRVSSPWGTLAHVDHRGLNEEAIPGVTVSIESTSTATVPAAQT
jgi:hypothetical protein